MALRWNNPKIHDAERRKTWLACDAHEQSLADFKGKAMLVVNTARSFLRETERLS